jgi:hypothetical protein
MANDGNTLANHRPLRQWTLAVLADQDGGRSTKTSTTASMAYRTKSCPTPSGEPIAMASLYATSTPVASRPPPCYQLTDLGRSLADPIAILERGGEINWSEVKATRQRRNLRGEL